MNEQESQAPPSVLSTLMGEIGWVVIQLAIRSVGIWFLWNVLVTTVFTKVPEIAFGHAFLLLILVKLTFSNLDGYSKYQTKHLFDLSQNLRSLIVNQAFQNNSILTILKELHNRNASDSEKFEVVSIDEVEKENYNMPSSENNNK